MLIWFSHANIETTLDTYTHATEKMAEQSVEIFEKVTKENLPTKISPYQIRGMGYLY